MKYTVSVENPENFKILVEIASFMMVLNCL